MQLYLDDNSLPVYKALASDTRLTILNHLSDTPSTVSEVAKAMGISKAIMSRHFKILEDANLISLSKTYASADSRKKVYTLRVDRANINFPKKIYLPYKRIVNEIKLGNFSDFYVVPSCGMVSKDKVIERLDDPRVFVSNERIDASLLWFADGYVDYKIPNTLEPHQHLEMLDLSLEIASEFPISNNNWPSDITFWINNVPVGTWTSPGNYSDVPGKLTPAWWDKRYSQYGLLKHLRITNLDTGMDADKLSDVNLTDLNLKHNPFITLRIGIDPDAQNKGGITIFGEHFGNHPQDIVLTLFYSEEGSE